MIRAARLLIVDDSATARALIRARLAGDPGIAVVGEACDPFEAREAIKALDPDVVTLDVEMPRMSGLEFLERLMRLRPTPVVMASSLTRAGAAATLEALALGAVDCVAKPDFDGLADKVKAAAGARVRPAASRPAAPARAAGFRPNGRILAIGASTGGVEALSEVLSHFPENAPPTLIVQHMPAAFTTSFAERLNRLCAARVEEARDGAPLLPGRIYLAPGGACHLAIAPGAPPRCRLVVSEPVKGHRPSVDRLFASVADVARAEAVGVILTGMGADGADGLLRMREAGAATIGQDAASSVIYGMPRVAWEIGAVERQLPLAAIARAALRACAATPEEAT